MGEGLAVARSQNPVSQFRAAMQTIRGESHSSVRAPGTAVEDFCGRIGPGIFIFASSL
jgi:hypothetical protein